MRRLPNTRLDIMARFDRNDPEWWELFTMLEWENIEIENMIMTFQI